MDEAAAKPAEVIDQHEKAVLLNRLFSRSVHRGPNSLRAPLLFGFDLFQVIYENWKSGTCIEFEDADEGETEEARIENGVGKTFIRLEDMRFVETDRARYVELLISRVDHRSKQFPVVDMQTRIGRNLRGHDTERGGLQSHVVVRMPQLGAYDTGEYRCAIEYNKSISRLAIENLINKQFRRSAKTNELSFSVSAPNDRGKIQNREYRYWPKLELSFKIGGGTTTLRPEQISHLVFTRRDVKENTAGQTEIIESDFLADIEIRVVKSKIDGDEENKTTVLRRIKRLYESRGFKSQIYYKNVSSGPKRASVGDDLLTATDLVLSPRRMITLVGDAAHWRQRIDDATVTKMQDLLDDRELWTSDQLS